jgi:two-component system alkaline phosphatase synthesis response regulator PhoP
MDAAKILMVDDDADLTAAVSAILESEGYCVVTASDRASGMKKAKSDKPDLILLDVMMEAWQDGFEMARELKKEPDLKATPILMFTSIESKTGIEFKSAAGDPTWLPVEGFLEKPVEREVLLAEVKKLLAK